MKNSDSKMIMATQRDSKLQGVVFLHDLLQTSQEQSGGTIEPYIVKDEKTVYPTDSLDTALEKISASESSENTCCIL